MIKYDLAETDYGLKKKGICLTLKMMLGWGDLQVIDLFIFYTLNSLSKCNEQVKNVILEMQIKYKKDSS